MSFVSSFASIGLGIASFVKQNKAADAQKAAQIIDDINREAAAELEFDKLDINIEQLTRQAQDVTGSIGSALAGAGAEAGSGVSAQARAVTFAALARDVEILNLNTDIAVTQLGFGPETKVGKKMRGERTVSGRRRVEGERFAKDATRLDAFLEARFGSRVTSREGEPMTRAQFVKEAEKPQPAVRRLGVDLPLSSTKRT